jgi:hypothetical protein
MITLVVDNPQPQDSGGRQPGLNVAVTIHSVPRNPRAFRIAATLLAPPNSGAGIEAVDVRWFAVLPS